MRVRKVFLAVPAYILAVTGVFASISLLPTAAGILLASALMLGILTSISLLHGQLEGEDLLIHFFIWIVTAIVGLAFASETIPGSFGPAVHVLADGSVVNWYHVLFIVLQQALYFGIHAFCDE